MKTINVIATGVVAVAVSGIAAGTSHAQTMTATAPVTKPFTLKLGAYLPTDSKQTDFAGSAHFDLGVVYEFSKTKTQSPLLYGVYADYVFQSSKTLASEDLGDYYDDGGDVTETATGKSSAYDIGIQGRYLFTADPLATVKPYAGLGIGFYSSMDKLTGTQTETLDEGSVSRSVDYSHTDSGFGGKIMAGADFKGGYLGEVSYNFFPGDSKFSGVGINVGYRF